MRCARNRTIAVTALAGAICVWTAQIGVCDEKDLQDAIASIQMELEKLEAEIKSVQIKMARTEEKIADIIGQIKDATGQTGGSTGDLERLHAELDYLKAQLNDYSKQLKALLDAKAIGIGELQELTLLGPQPEPPDYE